MELSFYEKSISLMELSFYHYHSSYIKHNTLRNESYETY